MDVVNTISWRGAPERQEDHLSTVDDALRWCVRAGVLSDAESAALAAHSGFGDALLPGGDLAGLAERAEKVVTAVAQR